MRGDKKERDLGTCNKKKKKEKKRKKRSKKKEKRKNPASISLISSLHL